MSSYKRLLQITAWLAVVAWMIVIFSMSHQKAEQSSELSTSTTQKIFEQLHPTFNELPEEEKQQLIEKTETAVRKTAHMSEYFILSALIIIALLFNNISHKKRALFAIALCCAYAVTDEIHQIFIDGRSCKVTDILIDAFGIILCAVIYLMIAYIIKKTKNRKLLR